MDYGFRNTQLIKTLQSYTAQTRVNFELMLIFNIVKYFGFSNIIEFGFKEGKTFAALLEALESGSLTAVDIEFDTSLYDKYYKDTQLIDNKSISFREMSSVDFNDRPRRYHFVIVDGDHTMPTILDDVKKSFSLVTTNGIVMIDDFEWEDVNYAIDQVLEMNTGYVPFLMDYQAIFFHHISHDASNFLDSELIDIFGSFCLIKDVQYKGFHVRKIESLPAVTNHDDIFKLICERQKL